MRVNIEEKRKKKRLINFFYKKDFSDFFQGIY